MLQKNTIKRMKERERLKRTQSFIELVETGLFIVKMKNKS